MTKVFHYVPELSSKFLCAKGGLHAEEALNLVCLDPLCRSDPLGCSICFVNLHKHHKVVGLDKFIDEYTRNVKVFNQDKAIKKIEKYHSKVHDLISKLRGDINRELDSFEQSIQQYAEELRAKTNLRQHISASLGIPLEPASIKQSRSSQQFRDSLRFILNNSLFDQNNNMINVTDVLKKDQDRIYALLDKMVNMTEYCQQYIKDVVRTLHFSDHTIKTEKIEFKEQLSKMQLPRNQFDAESFKEQLQHHKIIKQEIQLRKPNWRSNIYPSLIDSNPSKNPQKVRLTFSTKNKHQMIEIKNKFQVGVSNVTALKPQFALLTPHLTTNPNEVKEWTLKINNCRNFASENTLGIGIGLLNDINESHFEGHHPKNLTLLTSQGYVIENGRSRKTNLIFGTGDLLYCRYDPFYKLFEISKENGRKISLTVDRPQNQELFACVRLTYASDQVQIL